MPKTRELPGRTLFAILLIGGARKEPENCTTCFLASNQCSRFVFQQGGLFTGLFEAGFCWFQVCKSWATTSTESWCCFRAFMA